MTTTVSPAEDNLAQTKRFAVLAAAAGLSTWAIDTAATQVGLPSMQSALGLSVTDSQWILNITLMILAGLVTVGGALGDRAGRMRMFRLGLFLIIGASLVTFGGGLVNQFLIVMGGRALAGVGAALMLPASTAVLLDVFPREERGFAQGRMMMISMAVTAFAPTVIGLIIQNISWPAAYLATGAAGVVTIVLSRKVIYQQVLQKTAPFDYLGGVLVFVSVALITIGVMQAGTDGLTAPSVLLMVGAGLVTGAVLVVLSLRKAAPLIQFRLFQIRNVALAIFISFMRFLPNVLMGAFVARYVQEVLGLSPTVTGLLMILPILSQVVAAPIGGRMLDKMGPRRPVSIGVVLLVLGLSVLALGFSSGSIVTILIGTIMGGFGFSLTNPVTMAALSQTPIEQRGMAAGLFPLASQFGTTMWVALLSAGLSIFMANAIAADPAMTSAAAQAEALSMLAWIAAAVTLITLGAALLLKGVPSAAVGGQGKQRGS